MTDAFAKGGYFVRRAMVPVAELAFLRDAHTRLFCLACARQARIDLVDLNARRVHLSCDRCYRMWQEQIRADDPARLSRPTLSRQH